MGEVLAFTKRAAALEEFVLVRRIANSLMEQFGIIPLEDKYTIFLGGATCKNNRHAMEQWLLDESHRSIHALETSQFYDHAHEKLTGRFQSIRDAYA